MLNQIFGFIFKRDIEKSMISIYEHFIEKLQAETDLELKVEDLIEINKESDGSFRNIPEIFVEALHYKFEGIYVSCLHNRLYLQRKPSDNDYLGMVALRVCCEILAEKGGGIIEEPYSNDSQLLEVPFNLQQTFENLMMPNELYSPSELYIISCKNIHGLTENWLLPTKRWF
jgi:hypothetical protein